MDRQVCKMTVRELINQFLDVEIILNLSISGDHDSIDIPVKFSGNRDGILYLYGELPDICFDISKIKKGETK